MILFVVSDAGPAKYVSKIIEKINSPYFCVGTLISKKIFDSFNIQTVKFSDIDLDKINIIITGTCLGNCIDKKALRIAKEKSIPSISVIEHWSLYKERFVDDEGDLLLPDYIFVNDKIAKKEAVKSGLPEKKIIVAGNPFLGSLSKKILFPIKKTDWLKQYGFNHRPVVTFISEVYKEDFPKGSLNYPGFDEFQVIGDLIEITSKNNLNLLIRRHPAESPEKYNDYLSKAVRLDNKNDYDSTIINSDFIVGLGSIFLIEASMFRDDIISYRPNEKVSFIGNELGYTTKVTNKKRLEEIITGQVVVKKKEKVNISINSTKRINEIISEILQSV